MRTGGGRVEVVTDTLVLDGQVSADGVRGTWTYSYGGQAGSGGSVVLRAGVLSGNGAPRGEPHVIAGTESE